VVKQAKMKFSLQKGVTGGGRGNDVTAPSDRVPWAEELKTKLIF